MASPLSPHFRAILIEKYIGKEIYHSVHPKTRYILIKEAVQQFQIDMISRYGSLWNYHKDWIKRQGFKSYTDYTDYLAKRDGFSKYNEYQTFCAKKAGFKSRYERMVSKALSQGYKSLHELYKERLRRMGFKNQKEYRDHLCKKWGAKSYHHITQLKKKSIHLKNQK